MLSGTNGWSLICDCSKGKHPATTMLTKAAKKITFIDTSELHDDCPVTGHSANHFTVRRQVFHANPLADLTGLLSFPLGFHQELPVLCHDSHCLPPAYHLRVIENKGCKDRTRRDIPFDYLRGHLLQILGINELIFANVLLFASKVVHRDRAPFGQSPLRIKEFFLLIDSERNVRGP